MRLFFILLFAASVQAQGFEKAPDTPYNRGVDAFRNKDFAKARIQWGKAISEGEENAFNNLGFLLFNGLGGPTDRERGVQLWLQAAQMGQAESQWHLAHAYSKGLGIRDNDVEAYAWFTCAVATYDKEAIKDGDSEARSDAKKSAEKVFARLPKNLRQAAQDLAKSYIALYSGTRPRE